MTPSFYASQGDDTSEEVTTKRLASIVANLKCELFAAVNNTAPLRLFYDSPKYDGEIPVRHTYRTATLKDILSAVEYIGGISVQMEATNTVGSNPTAKFSKWGAAKYPLSLDLNASISEASHLQNTYYFSADFARLYAENDTVPAKFHPDSVNEVANRTGIVPGCGKGNELEGKMRLYGTISSAIVASDMNDISVWPKNADYPNAADSALDAKYTGEIDTTVDFTTTSSFSGGPTWDFTHVSLPNGNDGLLNANRIAKNELQAVFLPICITSRFHPINSAKPYRYKPDLPAGTPRWAYFLPQCNTPEAVKNKRDLFQHAIETIQHRQIQF